MVRVYKMIAYAAKSETNVLIEGETGTGKELVARAIHSHSSRSAKSFTAVNCSALTETLLESELFGYVKGSFTGAATDRAGLFESTAGGTIFLDEISSASQSLQASLLRVIQEREVRRVGSSIAHKIDVRIIAASNGDLEKMAEAGEFRADLFYRLSVLTIPVPPLRERGKSDLQLLTHHLLKKYGDKIGSQLRIAEEALEVLARYDWAGNVRELENAVEYAVAVCSDELIRISDLPEKIVEKVAPVGVEKNLRQFSLADDRPSLEELNRRYVQLILAEAEGNKSRAAEILGINRRTLYRYLNASGEDFEPAGEVDETAVDSA
jgi:transcriptional regulator with PAS, ATPase and Fis domain